LVRRSSLKRKEQICIRTERLELVAMDGELAVAQVDDRIRFFRMLGVRPTANWPPPLVDTATMSYTRDRLMHCPEEVGWQAWVWIDPVDKYSVMELVGFGGFAGQPDDQGTVEIGYSLLPAREGFGYASEAVAALLLWAKGDERVRTIVAHTLKEGVASQKLLKRHGFALAQARPDPAILRWERAA
jgi:RimJ/RimL family protein N-acetyltransferase